MASLADFGLKVPEKSGRKSAGKICLWVPKPGGGWRETDICYSRSVVTSWLQKSVRRGNWLKAALAALILVQNEPWYFWRRVRVIAVEDVMSDPSLFGAIYGLMREFEAVTGYRLSGKEVAVVSRVVDFVCGRDSELCDEVMEYVRSLAGFKSPVLNWDAQRLAVVAAIWLARARKDRSADAFQDLLMQAVNARESGSIPDDVREWLEELTRVDDYVFDEHLGRPEWTWWEYGSETVNETDEYAEFKKFWKNAYSELVPKEKRVSGNSGNSM